MLRRLFTAVCALSLVLCLALGVLWVRRVFARAWCVTGTRSWSVQPTPLDSLPGLTIEGLRGGAPQPFSLALQNQPVVFMYSIEDGTEHALLGMSWRAGMRYGADGSTSGISWSASPGKLTLLPTPKPPTTSPLAYWRLFVPYQVLIPITALLPLLWVYSTFAPAARRRARVRRNQCPDCGCDLRGSTLCCPKCGRKIAERALS